MYVLQKANAVFCIYKNGCYILNPLRHCYMQPSMNSWDLLLHKIKIKDTKIKIYKQYGRLKIKGGGVGFLFGPEKYTAAIFNLLGLLLKSNLSSCFCDIETFHKNLKKKKNLPNMERTNKTPVITL